VTVINEKNLDHVTIRTAAAQVIWARQKQESDEMKKK
jgi:hypothetical protein